ncbi:MAG TPA: hypothetical protein VLJ79_11250 [Candidatus Binatia bacterium]|nr:hypothetical protein [Candidatus Binatia bacterium]
MKALALFLVMVLGAGIFGYDESFGAAGPDMTQTVSGGGVTVAVTYVNPSNNESPRFQVTLNTHSVGLDSYDFKTLALLRDGTGKNYSPIKVENKGGGHHRQVTLTFPKISPEAKRLEIVIKDIAGVKERTFRWNLE